MFKARSAGFMPHASLRREWNFEKTVVFLKYLENAELSIGP
jgi:hypothetical protein